MQVLKEDVLNTIMETAQEMFLANGYIETSLINISKQAKISKSNLYNYFESKEALFEKLVEPAIKNIHIMKDFFQNTIFDIDLMDLENSLNATIPNLYKDKERILLLLDCAKGTKYESTIDDIVESLELKLKNNIFIDREKFMIAEVISRNLILSIIQILRNSESENEMKTNIKHLVSYHVNGIRFVVA